MLPAAFLVANRGEIAIRILRAAAELGIRTVAVFAEDDERCLHTARAGEARRLRGRWPAAYLDMDQMIGIAKKTGCDAIHPGYGFLSENAGFARRCREDGIGFIGPRPEILELFGDKARARSLAERCGVPLLRGTNRSTSVEEAEEFFSSLGAGCAMMVKALAGGGGRPGDTEGWGASGLDCWAFYYRGKLRGLVPLVGINSGRRLSEPARSGPA